jgi:hypothetical protein
MLEKGGILGGQTNQLVRSSTDSGVNTGRIESLLPHPQSEAHSRVGRVEAERESERRLAAKRVVGIGAG